MTMKWITETFRKTEIQADGESHEYSGERYWIDLWTIGDKKADVVIEKVIKDNGQPACSGKFRVDGSIIHSWVGDSIQQVAEIGENLINTLFNDIKAIMA